MCAVEMIPHFVLIGPPLLVGLDTGCGSGRTRPRRNAPIRDRLDRVPHAHAGGHRLGDVGEDTPGDSAEERCAVGGSLLRHRALEREAEDGGDDPEPQRAPGAAAGCAAHRDRAAERAQHLEAVAQAVGDALEHGADERAAVVPQREADEGAARVRVGVRRPLAGEVGQEDQALHAGLPALRLREQLVERLSRARARPGASRGEPAAESMTPIACHTPGTAWQKTCARASRVEGGLRERREDDAGRAEDDRGRPGRVDADAERAGGLVAGARRDRHPVGV